MILMLLILISFSQNLLADDFLLENQSLILTHTSKFYHSGSEAENETTKLISNSLGPVIALAQKPLNDDGQWYGTPVSEIDFVFYSKSGEHKLHFPELTFNENFELHVAGGYLSACLGRTLSELMANFIKNQTGPSRLVVNLHAKAIFTGYSEENNNLIPATPYGESILDNSMDGLNLSQVLKLVSEDNFQNFLEETFEISVYKKSSLIGISQELFLLKIYMGRKEILNFGEDNAPKEIIFKIVD